MIRKTIAITGLLLAFSAWTATAAAETHEPGWDEQPAGETGEESRGGGHLSGGDSLPAEAINWADFSYAEDTVEHEGATIHMGPPVLANVINFILLLVIIYLIARKPLSSFLEGRSSSVKEQLAEAQKMLEEANEQLTDYSTKLERMDEEMTRLNEEFIAAGEAERDRLVSEAGAKAERMREESKVRIQQEFSQLREELRVETIEKAVTAARELLQTEVKEADQRKLAEDYVERLEREGLGQ